MQFFSDSLDTAEDLAGFLKVSVSYVRKLTRTAGLPAVRIGHSVRYDRQTVLNWLNTRESKNGAIPKIDPRIV